MRFFFSVFFVQNKLTSLLNPHHLFPQIHTNTNTPTHKHKHTDKSSQRVPCPGPVSRTSSSSLVAELRGWVWLGGSGLWVEEHRYKILIVFLFWGWCGFECLISDVGFDGWSVMSVWMFDRWCGFWSVMWVLRERGRKEIGNGRDKEKERRRRRIG